MKYIFSLLFFFFFFFKVGAQIILKGKVTDEHKVPLLGVNVFIQGTIEGTSTDEQGNFSFHTKEKGRVTLVFKYISMEDIYLPISLDVPVAPIFVRMKESNQQIGEITVAAQAFSPRDRKQVMLLQTMDIETTAGSGGSISSALQTLPSVQRVGESAELFVRGGSGVESKTFIDGLEILRPYFSGVPDVAQHNRFSPHTFKSISFTPGGYSLSYGEALSALVELETNDHPNKSSSVIALTPYGIQGGYNYLSRNERTSADIDLGYYNFKHYYQLIPQYTQWDKAPRSVMLSGTFKQDVGEQGRFKWYGYANKQEQSIQQPLLEEQGRTHLYESKNENILSVMTYQDTFLQEGRYYIGYGLNYNQDQVVAFQRADKEQVLQHQLRTSLLNKLSPSVWLSSGVEGFLYQYKYLNTHTPIALSLNDYQTAFWIEGIAQKIGNFSFRGGFRSQYDKAMDKAVFLPRITLNYATGKYHQLSANVGQFSQRPQMVALALQPHLQPEKATHYTANFIYEKEKKIFRADIYYKKYENLLTGQGFGFTEVFSGIPPTQLGNQGDGWANGFALFYRDAQLVKGFDYWLSYTYLDTQRKYLDFPSWATPTYAPKHTGNVVLKYFFEQAGIFTGISYGIASGRPYYNPLTPNFLSDRTPWVHSTNANLAFLRKWGNTFHTVVLAVSNLLGNEQIFSYRYASDGGFRLPVTLPYKRSFMIGWFISIGKDRSQEILEQLP